MSSAQRINFLIQIQITRKKLFGAPRAGHLNDVTITLNPETACGNHDLITKAWVGIQITGFLATCTPSSQLQVAKMPNTMVLFCSVTAQLRG